MGERETQRDIAICELRINHLIEMKLSPDPSDP
jgi:hypothetical protein